MHIHNPTPTSTHPTDLDAILPLSSENLVVVHLVLLPMHIHNPTPTSTHPTDLDAILPLSGVDLVVVHPLHGALAMAHIVEPHALVYVARRVLSHPPAMTNVLHQITIIVGLPLTVLVHPTLNKNR